MTLMEHLARRRVSLGFVTAVVAIVLAQPTWKSWRDGLLVAIAGEAIRVWAAGHLEKSREVTRSGPYRWMRHPLYVGSSVMAAGIVIASHSVVLAIVAAVYMVVTITAAVRIEDDRYSRSEAEPMPRQFSLSRVVRNREYRAATGLAVGFALLAAKLLI